ncbi:hypothetical protein BY458DRAFT_506716 [Sporodiniella umbellata]|nr:hypothetical protein BY458DRAFT_506716 [Sporodiniella umbellata]
MTDQSSTYSMLEKVPLMISPQYKLPKKIVIDQELQPMPGDISQLIAYPFSIERKVLAQIEACRMRNKEEEETLKAKQLVYEQEKEDLKKAAAKKIAPGFLNTDIRILKADDIQTANPNIMTHSRSQERFKRPLGSEQNSPIINPWNSPEADFNALRSILDTPTSRSTPTYTLLPTLVPYSPTVKSRQIKSDGHWKIRSNTAPGSTPPIIPPKPLDVSVSSTQTVPASPPKHLIEELNNMGFTRAQATEALEKNQHDLTKATNFLLDQA